jgi:hypothetical protein
MLRTPHQGLALLLSAAVLTVAPWKVRADVVTINPGVDANLTDPTGTGNFTLIDTNPTGGLDIRDFAGASPNFDHRSVIQYNLSPALPAGAVIQGVTFTFQSETVTSDTGRTVGVLGYGGSGSLTLADATAAATQLTSYDNFALGLGKHTIDLGPSGVSLVQSILSGGKILNLRLQGTTFGTNTVVDSLEMANALPQFYSRPTIAVTFAPAAVPEPSVLTLSAVLATPFAAVGFRRLQKRSRVRQSSIDG